MPADLTLIHDGERRFRAYGRGTNPLGEPLTLPSPADLRFPDWPDDQGVPFTLPGALRWYLERYPYDKDLGHRVWKRRADEVVDRLDQWGRQVFESLSASQPVYAVLVATRAQGAALTLRVQSADPEVLAWPWEALRDPTESGRFAFFAGLERAVPGLSGSQRVERAPSPGPLRVLLISPRPKARDIDARAVSGPLVTTIRREGLPVQITVARPPTFAALRQFIKRVDYDVLHFDGHGDQGDNEGVLIFENHRDPQEVITASQLAILLREAPVPVVVLTACRSAGFDAGPSDPFGTVATELLRAGVSSVVAMSHVLHRDAAACFTPAFYRALAQDRDVGSAVSAARRALQHERRRETVWGSVNLRDDLLPVQYTRQPPRLPPPGPAHAARQPEPPGEAGSGPWLLGRDTDVQRLERALQGAEPLTVVAGPSEAGKTLLIGDLVRWLYATGGRPTLDWVDLRELRGAGALLNRLGMVLGQPFFGLPAPKRIRRLVEAVAQEEALWVWDGVEAVDGWSLEDQQTARSLITALHGRALRVLAAGQLTPSALRGAHTRELQLHPPIGDWHDPGWGARRLGVEAETDGGGA